MAPSRRTFVEDIGVSKRHRRARLQSDGARSRDVRIAVGDLKSTTISTLFHDIFDQGEEKVGPCELGITHRVPWDGIRLSIDERFQPKWLKTLRVLERTGIKLKVPLGLL